MTVATQLEILDLRHFSARQLRPLLEDEARTWKQRLRWDYQSSTELLLQYLDSRVLPGFVALDRGRICGFTFCVYEGHKAVIGDAYAMADDRAASLTIAKTLLRHLLEMLQHSPDIDRIESQLLLYDIGMMEDIFTDAGFAMFPRKFVELDLQQEHRAIVEPESIPAAIMLSRWSADDYHPSAELIFQAYAGHIDAQVNDQYRSLHGSLRFLHNIVRFPGCGVFDAGNSWVLRSRDTGGLVAIVLASNVGERVAHITQLCVAPAYRGRGLGELLMRHCVAQLAQSGFQAITLTVTEANLPAMKLYGELGFVTRQGFEAMVYSTAKS